MYTRATRRTRFQPHPKGTSLLETIIGLTLLTVLVVGLFTLISGNLATLFASKARATALLLAQEKVESLKNLPYDNLSTVNGSVYPSGTIPDEEEVTRNNVRLHIDTDIRYIDDDYDGNSLGTVVGKPTDLYPYDYKKITIRVYAPNSTRKYAELSSIVSAKAAETAGNTGVLIVKVINANGEPVEGATVAITNPHPAPSVNLSQATDVQGQVVIPKLPPDAANGYHVVVSKAGYSSDQTLAVGGGLPSPTKPDFGMIAQQTTVKTFAIDLLANATLTLKKVNGQPLDNQVITLTGQKTTNSAPVIFKTTLTLTTDANGVAQLNLVEWDSYTLSISGYDVLSANPFLPLSLIPGGFTSSSITVATQPNTYPIITQLSPPTVQVGSVLTLDITGSHLSGASTLKLRKSGQADQSLSGISYTAPDLLTGSLNTTGLATGSWDVVVANGGFETIQASAVSITP